jgi:hypothetical protein
MTPQQLADRWGQMVSARTLANWRCRGAGPAYVKVGSRVFYRMADIFRYEKQQTQSGRR